MYLNTTVKIPEIKGKIITKKKGGTTYILYQYGSEYNQDKRYAVPQRAIVGKVSPDDPGLMFPNDKFMVYFPDAEIPEELPFAYRSCCLKIGSCVIIRKVLDEYKLVPMLAKRFGRETGLILDLISYLIVEEENAGQYYPDFAFTHPLFTEKMTIYSDSKVCRLLNSITRDQCISFLDDWNKNRDHKSRIYISYDSTNKNSDAGDISIVEYGKPKDDKGLPVFNLSIAMDKTNRVPLFYEEYPGSITDVSQFSFMVDKVIEYSYEKIGFILDRGYFSKENIQYIDKNKYTFIIMCKGCRALVSSLVLENRGSFETKREATLYGMEHVASQKRLSKMARKNAKNPEKYGNRYKDAVAQEKFWNKQYKEKAKETQAYIKDLQRKYGSKRIKDVKTKESKYGEYIRSRIVSNGEIVANATATAAANAVLTMMGAPILMIYAPDPNAKQREYARRAELEKGFDRYENRRKSSNAKERKKANRKRDILTVGGLYGSNYGY